MATWITSDLHLNHHNILSLEAYNNRKNGLEYIDTIDKYNDMIIQQLNREQGEELNATKGEIENIKKVNEEALQELKQKNEEALETMKKEISVL